MHLTLFLGKIVKLDMVTYGNMGIPCISLWIGSREHSVNKNKGTDDLCGQSGALAVSIIEPVGSTTVLAVVSPLECLHKPTTAYGSQALSYHVQYGSNQRDLPSQE